MPINELNEFEYYSNDEPKCPWCDTELDISRHELYELYKEDIHAIECPCCEKKFKVRSEAKWTFHTDELILNNNYLNYK